ncbi:hypothetical protein O6H91_Y044900 [Diphasiastrum complanatum]|nr:hypothetical protein O6H91_Y044900 [Diphasiastrum complanatum]KAJ7297625.1 hypothetical protein O6H91_Y044900 [Diphasiastrum complanatum]
MQDEAGMDGAHPSSPTSSSIVREPRSSSDPLEQLKKTHIREREQLVLTKSPVTTMKFFTLAILKYLARFWAYAATHNVALGLVALLCPISWLTLFSLDGPHEKFLEECLAYFRFALWWVGLGVASSIGLGSGLHTFVLYLGPHIAMFTLKATLCGREDLKKAPYDTPQYGISSTWADRDCADIGSPKYPRLATDYDCYMVPLHRILVQVQPEAILWGIGTALGELPPYFISRAARQSGERLKELEDNTNEEGPSHSNSSDYLKKLKRWMFAHSQQLGFFTVLIFASVPNPLFDLAGIMCGQFLVPFWKFFSATLIGKAVFKTHIQTVFIILVCNAHTLDIIEAGLGWLLQQIPGFAYVLPQIMSVLNNAKDKFRHGKLVVSKPGNFSVAFIWNTLVLLMLAGYLGSIITSTAQGYLIEKQKIEVKALQAKQELLHGSCAEYGEKKKRNQMTDEYN